METDKHETRKLEIIEQSRKKAYGFGLFTVIVIVVMVVGAIRPSVSTIINLRKEIKQKTGVLETLSTKVDTLNSLAEQYDELGSFTEVLPLIYPSAGDSSLFMANIEEVCRNSGFLLKSVSFDNKGVKYEGLTPPLFEFKEVGLTVEGKDVDLISLLQDIEATPFYPVVRGVSYSSNVDDNGNKKFGINLMIFTIDDVSYYEGFK